MMMTMTMMMVMVMAVVMMIVVILDMRVVRVGAPLRVERRLDRREPSPQPFQQGFEYRIGPHAQSIGKNLYRHVSIAKMPGQTRQMREVAAADPDQWLGLDHHIDQAAVIEFECVAV